MSVSIEFGTSVSEAIARDPRTEKKPTFTVVQDPEAEEQGRGSVVAVTGLLAPSHYISRVLHATEHAMQKGDLDDTHTAKALARKVQEIDYPVYGNLVVGVERALVDTIRREADRTQKKVSGEGYSLGGTMLGRLGDMPELDDIHVLGSPMQNPLPEKVMKHLPKPVRHYFEYWNTNIPEGKRVTSTVALEDEVVSPFLSRHPRVQRYDIFEFGEHLTLPLREDVARTVAKNVQQTGTNEEQNGTFKHTLSGKEKPAGILLRTIFHASSETQARVAA